MLARSIIIYKAKLQNKNTFGSFPSNNSSQPIRESHGVVSSLQFALVGVDNHSSSCCFARRSDSRSIRCCPIEGVLILEGEEDDGRDELDDDDDDDDELDEGDICGRLLLLS